MQRTLRQCVVDHVASMNCRQIEDKRQNGLGIIRVTDAVQCK